MMKISLEYLMAGEKKLKLFTFKCSRVDKDRLKYINDLQKKEIANWLDLVEETFKAWKNEVAETIK